jgi:hypothetical protein
MMPDVAEPLIIIELYLDMPQQVWGDQPDEDSQAGERLCEEVPTHQEEAKALLSTVIPV